MGLHVLAKRGSTLGFGGILGIVAGGLAILILMLLIAWCVVRPRTRKMKEQQQQRRASATSSTDADLESILSKSSMASIPNASYLRVLQNLQVATAPRPRLVTVSQASASRRPAPSCPNTPSSPTTPRSAKGKAKRPSHTRTEPKSPIAPVRGNKLQRTKPHKPQQCPHISAPFPLPKSSPSPDPTLRRANSFDSASIYSADSAPRELHTQPFALDPTPAPAAPTRYTWAPRPHDPPGVVFLVTPTPPPLPVPVQRDSMSPIAEASEVSSLISASWAGSEVTVMFSPPASPQPAHLRAYDGSGGGGGRKESVGVPVSSPPWDDFVRVIASAAAAQDTPAGDFDLLTGVTAHTHSAWIRAFVVLA